MINPMNRETTPYTQTPPLRSVISGRNALEQSDRGVADLIVEALNVTGNGTSVVRQALVAVLEVSVNACSVPPIRLGARTTNCYIDNLRQHGHPL